MIRLVVEVGEQEQQNHVLQTARVGQILGPDAQADARPAKIQHVNAELNLSSTNIRIICYMSTTDVIAITHHLNLSNTLLVVEVFVDQLLVVYAGEVVRVHDRVHHRVHKADKPLEAARRLHERHVCIVDNHHVMVDVQERDLIVLAAQHKDDGVDEVAVLVQDPQHVHLDQRRCGDGTAHDVKVTDAKRLEEHLVRQI